MPDHIHRFRYDSPAGPVSEGRCACGATRRDPNSFVLDRNGNRARGSQYLDGTHRCGTCDAHIKPGQLATHMATAHLRRKRPGDGMADIRYKTPPGSTEVHTCDLCGREFTRLGLAGHRRACATKGAA